ncbi:hypothetical protein ACFL1R_05690 [Candidatus Latescibacterota bacterium]
MRGQKNAIKAFAVLSALLCAVAVFGQDTEKSEPRSEEESRLTYRAKGGGKYVRKADGSFSRILTGGVEAWHLDAKLEAQEGIYKSDPSEIRFYGGTTFRDSVRQLFADTLIYYENSREAFAIGNVRVSENGRTMLADSVRYQKNLSLLEAYGSVTVVDDSLNSSIHGTEAVFNDSTGYGLIFGEPVLKKEDDEGSIITITCMDTIEVMREEKITRLWKSVVMTKDSLTTKSERALYDDTVETLTLTGSPEIQYVISNTREDAPSILTTDCNTYGDTIRVFLHERMVTGALVIGDATSTSISTDSTGVLFDRSVIESAEMKLDMDDDFISIVSAEGTAQSYYHRNYAETNEIFVNTATGDTLTFYFDKGEISSMEITGYGGGLGKGKYYNYEECDIPAEPDSAAIGENVYSEP